MSLLTTLSNRHQQVYPQQMLQQAFDAGEYETVLRLHAFNVRWPTKRHWHHQVHSDFGLPCDDLCAPAPKRKGDGLIQQIKGRLRIEDVAERFTRLRGTGNALKGKCPLHGEQRGESFQVRVEEQDWRCWGQCGTHGDVIDFIRELETRGIEWRTNS